MNGTTVLQQSKYHSQGGERIYEYCLPATTNYQYNLVLWDTGNDGWNMFSQLTITGLYGNTVLKTTLYAESSEEYVFSLYYPVMKNQTWKSLDSSSTIAADWLSPSFDDSTWSSVTLGSTLPVAGAVYFRRVFSSAPGLAAYELEMNYMYGIVAYVNGVEVFRDHMDEGDVTPSTLSIDAYEEYGYHGVIRPSSEIDGESSVLAVELHFPSATNEYFVEFDAYMAALAPTTTISESSNCFVYPYSVTLTSSTGSPSTIFDFDRTKYWPSLPATVYYQMDGPLPHINGVRVWPRDYPYAAPGRFTLEGAMDAASNFTTVVRVTSAFYEHFKCKTFYGYLNAETFPLYRVTIYSASSADFVYAHEVQLATCAARTISEIPFTPSSYSVYVKQESLSIRPDIDDFDDCALSPALPEGLSFDSATCTITGTPNATLSLTTFTMSAVVKNQEYQGTFTLEVLSCSATLTRIVRTYQMEPHYESFTIKDMTTQQVVLEVPPNSGQGVLAEWTAVLCLTGSKYLITMDSLGDPWESSSFLYVRALFNDNEFETVARVRYDNKLDVPSWYIIDAKWYVAPQSQWFYKMGELPADWFDSETTGWESGAIGSVPESTNQIQLYKKAFDVASLADVSGFVLSLRYNYGCVIYLNGVEVFRNGVTGNLTVDSVSTNSYTSLLYRRISLPARTVPTEDTPSVDYLSEGTNMLAIAIVASDATQTASVFDCTLRLMVGLSSRAMDYNTAYQGMEGNPMVIANQYNGYSVYSSSCASNYLTIMFRDERREWLSAVTMYLHCEQTTQQVSQFMVLGRNANTETWTMIKNVMGLTWAADEKQMKIWLGNNKPWNQYRFENFGTGNPNECAWKFGNLDLTADALTAIPELSYPSPVVITRYVEMTEVYPTSSYYYDFTVSPALPTGLVIDANSGTISGRPTELSNTTCEITASKIGGGTSTTSITIVVESCMGEKGLVSFAALLDSYPEQASYEVHKGQNFFGEVIASAPVFKVRNGMNYFDWCLPHDLYTLYLRDSQRDGWANPAGWYLSVDVGEMVFDLGQYPTQSPILSVSFSTVLPFQVEDSEWKLWNSAEAVAEGWLGKDFDDSAWETKKAAELGEHASTTAYVRHEVNVPYLIDYQILNVRMKYAGGVVAYFNGVKVARFNLAEDFDASTEAMAVHDASLFSKFHVLLPNVNVVAGTNAMAFEIHRAAGENAIVFDATGVFGVNDCSPVVDSFSSIESSELAYGTKEDMFYLNPTTYGFFPKATQSFLSWTVENLEGSSFNAIGLQTSSAVSGYGFSLSGRWASNQQFLPALSVTNQTTADRRRTSWELAMAYTSFVQYKFVVDAAASDVVSTNAFVPLYCRAILIDSCRARYGYPPVRTGMSSAIRSCPEYMYGFSYRLCADGVLGGERQECRYYAPTDLAYAQASFTSYAGIAFSSDIPTFTGVITSFEVVEGVLPTGLALNATTGEITGTATGEDCLSGCSVTIAGANVDASANVTLSFHVAVVSIEYPFIGAGVHVVVGETVSLVPVITAEGASFVSFEATGLPEGLSINASTGEISGAATGASRSVEVTVKGFVDASSFLAVSFTLFVHEHSSATPAVSSDPSCSFSLRLYARDIIELGAVYLDSANSAETLALTVLAMRVGELKSVYVCLTEGEYIIHASGMDIVVLKGPSPLGALIDGSMAGGSFSTTPVCEESLDVECDIVMSDDITLKESGAASGTTYAPGEIVALSRSKSYEM